jgi:hypothetical protein
LGFNSPEWNIADLAAIFAGGFATGKVIFLPAGYSLL